MNNPLTPTASPSDRPRRPRSVARALAYPYDVPDCSYVIHAGHVQPIASDDDLYELTGSDFGARYPVIACGSNQSPSALAWKFSQPEDGLVPVVRIRLHDFDTVYCAHFAGYGSVPAPLHPAPGTVVTLFVNWLTESQLAHMHTTETGRGNYVFGELSNLNVEHECGPAIDRAGAYVTTRGALALDGCAVPLAEVEAMGRSNPALRQRDLIQSLLNLHSREDTVEAFVQRNIDDEDERERRQTMLAIGALPFTYPHFRPLG